MSLVRSVDSYLTDRIGQLQRWADFAIGWRKLGIRPGDLVLEVGSGQKPMARSDVLCDKFYFDSRERGGEAIVADRPLVVADAERLPFRDRVFDFAYTSHLVEHVDHPDRFCAELMRVARRGYITCPSEYAEKFIGWDVHRWFVAVDDGALVFTQKERPIYDMTLSAFYHSPERMKDGGPMARFIAAHRELFSVRFAWEDRFDCIVRRTESGLRAQAGWTVANLDAAEPRAGNGRIPLKRTLGSMVSRGIRAMHSKRTGVQLMDLLACPACHGAIVARDSSSVLCAECGGAYRVVNGVPFLL